MEDIVVVLGGLGGIGAAAARVDAMEGGLDDNDRNPRPGAIRLIGSSRCQTPPSKDQKMLKSRGDLLAASGYLKPREEFVEGVQTSSLIEGDGARVLVLL